MHRIGIYIVVAGLRGMQCLVSSGPHRNHRRSQRQQHSTRNTLPLSFLPKAKNHLPLFTTLGKPTCLANCKKMSCRMCNLAPFKVGRGAILRPPQEVESDGGPVSWCKKKPPVLTSCFSSDQRSRDRSRLTDHPWDLEELGKAH